ncbi:MAG: hypothetical protein AB4062_06135 [Crocosphaera sp.]
MSVAQNRTYLVPKSDRQNLTAIASNLLKRSPDASFHKCGKTLT